MDKAERKRLQEEYYKKRLLRYLDEKTVNKIMKIPSEKLYEIVEYLLSGLTVQEIVAIHGYFESYLESDHGMESVIGVCKTRYIPTGTGYLQEYESNLNKYLKLELIQDGDFVRSVAIDQSNGIDILKPYREYNTVGSLARMRGKPLIYASRDLIERVIAYWLTNSTMQVVINRVNSGILINYFKDDIFKIWDDYKSGKIKELPWSPRQRDWLKSKHGEDEWGKAIIY